MRLQLLFAVGLLMALGMPRIAGIVLAIAALIEAGFL